MSLKQNVDFSTFSDPKAASELFSNSIRKGFDYDSYGGKTKFKAVVLTVPIPVSPEDVKYFLGDTKVDGESKPENVSKFTYRARIIGENSPHSFLPDPCDIQYASDPVAALEITSMHTLFVSNTDGEAGDALPRIGSTVEVELTKNAYSYNIQFGRHVNVVTNPDSPSSPSEGCDSIRDAIDNGDVSALWSYQNGENKGGFPLDSPQVMEVYEEFMKNYPDNPAPPDGFCGGLDGYPVVKCKTGTIGGAQCTLHPIFFDKVKQKYDAVKAQNFGEDFKGGSTLRSVKTQISLRLNNARRPLTNDQVITGNSSLCNPPTANLPTGKGQGSRHLYGLAIDFGGILLSGGTSAAKAGSGTRGSTARESKTYAYLLKLQDSGFKNYSAEPWHWSVDGR